MTVTVTTKAPDPLEPVHLPKTLRLRADGVHGTFAVGHAGVQAMALDVLDRERVLEFQQMVRRALNTWEGAPQWVSDLADALDTKLPGG